MTNSNSSTATSQTKPKPINWASKLAYAFLIFLALICAIVAGAISPIGISLLASFANDQESISIEGVSGSFYSQIEMQKFVFDNPQIGLQVVQAELDVSLSCFFGFEVCIEALKAKQIEVLLKPSSQDSQVPAPTVNKYITLPLKVGVKKLNIAHFSLHQQNPDTTVPMLDITNMSAQLTGFQKFAISKLNIADIVFYQAPAEQVFDEHKNTLATANNQQTQMQNWLVALQNWQYQPIRIPKIFIPVNVDITSAKISQFCVREWPSNQAQLCTKQSALKIGISKQNLSVNVQTEPEQQLAKHLTLGGKINLAKLFTHNISLKITPNAELTSNNASALDVELKGHINNTELTLSDSSGSIVAVNIAGDVSEKMLPITFKAKANKISQNISKWLPSVYVPIESANVEFEGNIEQYRLNISTKVISQNASLIIANGQLSITDKHLSFDNISTSGDIGLFKASSHHQLKQQDGQLRLANNANLSFTDFQIKPLLQTQTEQAQNSATESVPISTSINGSITLNADYTEQHITGSLMCKDVAGWVESNAKQYNLSLLCNLNLAKNGLLKVNTFSLKHGQNVITAKGQVKLPKALSSERLQSGTMQMDQAISDFTLNIDMPALASLYDGLNGNMSAKLKLSGTVNAPNVVANVALENFAFEENRVAQANIDATLLFKDKWKTSFDFSAIGVGNKQLLAQEIHASVQGDTDSHTIMLNLQHPDYGFSHEFSGQAYIAGKESSWSGEWLTGNWDLPFDQFRLSAATKITLSAEKAAISAHCWLSNLQHESSLAKGLPGGQLCINTATYESGQALLAAKFDYDLNTPLFHYVPDIIQASSSLPLSSDISASYNAKQGVEADIFNLITQARLITTRHTIDLAALVVNARLDDHVLNTNIFAGTKETGAIGISSSLSLSPDKPQHTAQLRIEQFQLSPLLRFLPGAQKLAGLIQGSLQISGDLEKPNVNGQLYVENGELIIDNYPYPFSHFNQSIEVTNNEALIEGEFELGEGDAQYDAIVQFNDGISAKGNLTGAGMQLAYQNNELLLSPNVSFEVTPKKISLNGELSIPFAQLVLKKLPKTAKSASSDVIVVGKPVEPPLIPIGLDIDLSLLIDKPRLGRVNIDALDLRASLAGELQLKIQQKVNESTGEYSPMGTYLYGNVNILSGRYEAYGQMLQIRSGEIFFSGAPSLPQFDVTAIRNPLNTADQVIAGVRLSGNPVIPKVDLFSEPAMLQARQLSYLLQGTDLSGGSGSSNDVQLINMLVNYGIGSSENGVNKLGKSLGFESLNIQTAGQGLESQVQLTGRISDKVQVTYGVGLFEPVSVVILKYQLMPKLYIEASNGVERAVDLFYEMTRGNNQ